MADVQFERFGKTGVVTLNRPSALNALSFGMVDALYDQLVSWREDPSLSRVVVHSASSRAFCAGGDIRQLYGFALDKSPEFERFYQNEYRLDHLIATYPKPYISLIDGIVMGGGVGISIHGSHRVVTERLVWAMPETGIGFFPDIGATWFLPRLKAPGMGRALGLCGTRVGAGDAMALGLGTHCVAAEDLSLVLEALKADEELGASLARFAYDPGEAPLWQGRDEIAALFSGDDLLEIMGRLSRSTSVLGQKFFSEISEKSPLSLAVTFVQLEKGAALSILAEAFALEAKMAYHMGENPDFFEGVRAVVIDKNRKPAWCHGHVRDVSHGEVEAFF